MEMWGEPEQLNEKFHIFTSWPESTFINLASANRFGEQQFGFDRCSDIWVNTKSNECDEWLLVFWDWRPWGKPQVVFVVKGAI